MHKANGNRALKQYSSFYDQRYVAYIETFLSCYLTYDFIWNNYRLTILAHSRPIQTTQSRRHRNGCLLTRYVLLRDSESCYNVTMIGTHSWTLPVLAHSSY